MKLLQVTLGSGATPLSSTELRCYQVVIQNNAAASMRVGDFSVTSSAGILLASGNPGGSVNLGPNFLVHPLNLQNIYVIGTQNQVVDVFIVS